jgi:hypothetical protein
MTVACECSRPPGTTTLLAIIAKVQVRAPDMVRKVLNVRSMICRPIRTAVVPGSHCRARAGVPGAIYLFFAAALADAMNEL